MFISDNPSEQLSSEQLSDAADPANSKIVNLISPKPLDVNLVSAVVGESKTLAPAQSIRDIKLKAESNTKLDANLNTKLSTESGTKSATQTDPQINSQIETEIDANPEAEFLSFEAAYQAGQRYLDSDQFEQAIQVLQKSVALQPQAAAFEQLGKAYGRLGQYAQAVTQFQRAIQLDPSYLHAYSGMGYMLLEQQQYAEAIAAFEAAIEINPTFPWAYEGLGRTYLYQQNYAAAIGIYQQVLEQRPTFIPAVSGLAEALTQNQRLYEAIVILEQAVQLQPSQAIQQQLEQSLALLDDIQDFATHDQAGLSLLAVAQYQPALIAFEQALHLESTYSWTYFNLIFTLLKLERYEDAVQYYEQLQLQNPNFWQFRTAADPLDSSESLRNQQLVEIHNSFYQQALILETQGQLPEAIIELQRCLAVDDSVIEVYHKLIKLSQARGDASVMAILYNRLLHRDQLSEADYLNLIQFGSTLIRSGLATLVKSQLLANIVITPPRLCETQLVNPPQPELLLLQTLASLHDSIPTATQIATLNTYYHRVDRAACRQAIYRSTIQPLLVWAHNQIFCRYINTTAAALQLQQLLLTLGRIATDHYDDPHLALNLVHCSSFQPEAPDLLRLTAQINSRLGRHYEVVIAANRCFQAQLQDANLYTLAATSAIEVVQSSLPLWLNSIEQIVSWLTTAFNLHPASSRPRQLLDMALLRFTNRAISATREIGMQSSLATGLQLRQMALEQLNQQVKSRTQLLQSATQMPATTPARPSFGKVLVVGTHHIPQCYYYRVKQKLDHLSMNGLTADFMDGAELAGLQWQQRMMEIDAVILCRMPATFDVLRFIHYTRSLGIPVLYDIDDLIFDETHFPAPLESYAGTIDRSVHIHLTLDNPFFRIALTCCDGVIVSTQPLAEQARRFTEPTTPIWVYPNLMGDELVSLAEAITLTSSEPEAELVKPLRLFYGSGTKAHKQPFYEILVPALVALLEQYQQLELHLIGHFELPAAMQPVLDRVVIHEFMSDYSAYLYELQQADISISILEDTIATDCKSEIKWLEAAAFGIPSVLSPTATYRHVLQDGSEALFATTTEDWLIALNRLITSPELRQQIGKAAYQKAQSNYSATMGQRCVTQILQQHLPKLTRRRQRLLIANVFFAPQSIGGATRVAETNVRHLLEHYGHEYEIYVLCAENDPGIRAPYEVEQYGFGEALVTKLYIPGRDWADHQDETILNFCRRFYRQYEFDLIHFHCVQVLTAAVVDAAQELRIPYLITAHDGWWLSRYQFLVDEAGKLVDPKNPWSALSSQFANPLSKLQLEAERQNLLARRQAELERRNHLMRCLRQAKAVLAVSEPFAEIYRSVGLTNVVVNENGIEPFEILPRQPNPSGKVRVAHIGGVSQHKGFHLFREALEQGEFQHLEAVVIDHSLELEEVVREQWGTVPVTLKPKVKQTEISQLYSEIDVLVAPSIWPESYGLVTREALAAGVWVIASNRGAIGADVEEGVNGNVVDVEDHMMLLETLRLIDQNYQSYLKFERKNRVRFRSAADQMQELTELYRSRDLSKNLDVKWSL
jgi:glycosyltransferase involved in cell wall biosynthesis/tetratricopeptide (TPR) repeat protein